jgi:hypothetical protein
VAVQRRRVVGPLREEARLPEVVQRARRVVGQREVAQRARLAD